MLERFALGAQIAFQPLSLLMMLLGVAWGILGGAMPGISGSIAMALLLPLTFGMDPTVALMMLAGVYIGAMYGGSITAILISTPGTPGAAATVIDGYVLHKKGQSGKALGVSLITGTIGGVISVFILVALAVPLSRVALAFGPPEYFALGVFGLALISSFVGRDLVKGTISAVLGLIVATAGTDPFSGTPRFTFGTIDLLGGVQLVAGMIGLFAVSEIFTRVAEGIDWERIRGRYTTDLPTLAELWKLRVAAFIGIVMGTIEGLLPGGGGAIASFIAYNEARRWSKHPEEFGRGSLEGVAAPETANNVVTGTAMIPLLTFGIPGSNSAAIMLAAMMLHGVQPGPALFERTPQVVYGLFVGMLVANVMMLVLGFLALRPSIALVNVRPPLLYAGILGLVLVGAYSINNSMFEVWVVLTTGVVGFGMRRFGFNILAMVLGLVLGFMVEVNLRRSLLISLGNPWVFFTRPISAALLVLAVITLLWPIVRQAREDRRARAAAAASPSA
ncbi:MAG: tripartite tricarboxylate transporter permease [Armatimonadota bacterium]|nr:tripartite tricarboxylate transporter permease [Armatimonadota bacterium]MDR7452145.1 tripartite tricarboxylate transporter permease [Armatimonadota bacterium]MDR7467869.1 tripartite tricarboxylate transporter permease [Armatimonadota bacterium]MDR7494757.1 tripartite tricarboxylate transporter permease [Armatimonadota bacterium]MDR7499582.1 tripartite tricarboxylate transporter permease [Armatimonadota bacterium]